MSRIGNKRVKIPSGVNVSLDGKIITANGKRGLLSFTLPQGISIKIEDNMILVKPDNGNKVNRQNWGSTRTQVNNLVVGVSDGFARALEISGVGYRAQMNGNELKLSLGYSHDVVLDIPNDLEVKVTKPTEIEVSGSSNQKVGEFCAKIMSWRPCEPYKGKGIKIKGSYTFRKEGKKK
jgi:large subunit ribosomal protein L6